MGMYTQIRGWLHISPRLKSEEANFNSKIYLKDFEKVKKEFHKIWKGDRAELATSTSCYNIGSDWEHFIFFGGSIKNYSSDLEGWINFLKNYYKDMSGRIELQYEEDNYATLIKFRDGEIQESIYDCEDKQIKL